jgi:hypothetical protein
VLLLVEVIYRAAVAAAVWILAAAVGGPGTLAGLTHDRHPAATWWSTQQHMRKMIQSNDQKRGACKSTKRHLVGMRQIVSCNIKQLSFLLARHLQALLQAQAAAVWC